VGLPGNLRGHVAHRTENDAEDTAEADGSEPIRSASRGRRESRRVLRGQEARRERARAQGGKSRERWPGPVGEESAPSVVDLASCAAVFRVGLPHPALVTLRRPGAGRKRTTRPRGMPTASTVRGFRAIPILRAAVRAEAGVPSRTRYRTGWEPAGSRGDRAPPGGPGRVRARLAPWARDRPARSGRQIWTDLSSLATCRPSPRPDPERV